MAGNVSRKSRQEPGLRCANSADQSQLSAQSANWNSRPGAVVSWRVCGVPEQVECGHSLIRTIIQNAMYIDVGLLVHHLGDLCIPIER